MFCKSLQILDFKCEVGEIGSDLNGAAGVVFADFDQLLASRSFEKDKLGPPSARDAPDFFQAENIFVKGNRFLQIGNPVAGVEELFYHLVLSNQRTAPVKEENHGHFARRGL